MMRFTNYLGVIGAVALIVACFLPWVYISSIRSTITGLSSGGTNFGKPGFMTLTLSGISLVLFIVSAVWAKRLNLFITAFNLAWSIRSYILVSQCEAGECPEKKLGLFLMLFLSILLFVMALLPGTPLKRSL